MRVLLSKNSRNLLFNFLKEKYQCISYNELATKLKISFRTLQNWMYEKSRYIPANILPASLSLIILDQQEDNWGKTKGGKRTYKILIEKYGKEEIRKRQINGGRAAGKIKRLYKEPLKIDIEDPLFLEFYGALLGDGWLSKWKRKNKTINLIGISGNLSLDKEFILYLKNNVKKLFNRNAYLRERTKNNSIELIFFHKTLIRILNDRFGFPIGLKSNLEIHQEIYNLGYDKVRYVIKGIFDTDGCFYFDRTPAGNPYPCINLTMKAPKLMNQVYVMLLKQGFKAYHYKGDEGRVAEKITLKGGKQVEKWMREINSSNPRNLNQYARVAQSG